ncbi:MAG: Gfo/Idh/MocA family oxidoreductase [Planctomycetales bacterium]
MAQTATSQPPFRFAMLGVWHPHATGIVRQIGLHPQEFQLVGCWDSDSQLLSRQKQAWSEFLPDLPTYGTAKELLAQPLDGVIVEGRVSENIEGANLAVDAGLPVLLEKPAGVSLPDFEALLSKARAKNLHVQMLYLFRYMSAVQEMFRLTRDERFGDIYLFRARMPKDLRLYESFVEDLGEYAGGIFFEMGGHMIDMMYHILGPARKIIPLQRHHHAEPGEFIDNGVAMFEFERAVGIVEVTALEFVPDMRRFEVFGTTGGCVIPNLGSGHLANQPTQPIEVFEQNSTAWTRHDLPAAVLQIRDLREFVAVVRGEKTPTTTQHDLQVQQWSCCSWLQECSRDACHRA